MHCLLGVNLAEMSFNSWIPTIQLDEMGGQRFSGSQCNPVYSPASTWSVSARVAARALCERLGKPGWFVIPNILILRVRPVDKRM